MYQFIMKLTNVKILLCVTLILTLYQEVQSFETTDIATNIVFAQYNNSSNDSPRFKRDDSTKIFGGFYAKEHQFPFMAVVHQLLGGGRTSQCGGSIISKRWVLTAGHCLSDEPREYLVVFGTIDKTGIGYNTYRGSGVSMITKQAFRHSQYQTSHNDIGLLYMPRDISFSSTIQPIQIAGSSISESQLNGRIVTVIGWGRDSSTSTGTKKLKYASLTIISSIECRKHWNINNDHICTAPTMQGEACQGDSGGPLILIENDVPTQVGIVSYGDGNCPSNRPGVFTKVSSFASWIKAYETMMYTIMSIMQQQFL